MATEQLHDILEDDESVIQEIKGRIARLKPTPALLNGAAVLTDRRLIFVGTSGMFHKITERFTLPYQQVDRIEQKGKIVIHADTEQWEIHADGPKEGKAAFANELQNLAQAHRSAVGPGEQGKSDRIDEEWRQVNPGWGMNRNKGERQMLYDLIESNEQLECVIGGKFAPDLKQAKFGDSLRSGIIVATNKRVVMVDKGVFGSTEVAEMGYDSIGAITYSTGMVFGGLQITGRGSMSFRVEMVDPKDDAKRFSDCVRPHLPGQVGSQHAQQAATPVSPPVSNLDSVVSDLEKLAGLLERGILSQEEFDAKKKQLLGL